MLAAIKYFDQNDTLLILSKPIKNKGKAITLANLSFSRPNIAKILKDRNGIGLI